MTNKTTNGKGAGMDTAQEKKVDFMQNRLSVLQELNKKIKVRNAFLTHLEILKTSEVQNPDDEHLEGSHSLQKIVLKFGHNDTYDIASPTLLAEIKSYLIERITVRISEVEHEIISSKI